MLPLLRLIRWQNLLIMVMTQVLVYQCLHPSFCMSRPFELPFLLLVLATVLIASAGYIVNDYFDMKIDVVNRPQEVLVGSYISRRWAMILHVILSLAGIMLAGWLSIKLGILFLLIVVLLYFYSSTLKRQPVVGNLAIALLLAATIWVVKVIDPELHTGWVFFFSWFAFITGWIREVVKDLEDLEGDRAYGCKTLPVVWGVLRTKQLVRWLVLVLMVSLVPSLIGFWDDDKWLLVYFLVCIILPLIIFHFMFLQAIEQAQFSRLSRFIKLVILLGILAMPVVCLSSFEL